MRTLQFEHGYLLYMLVALLAILSIFFLSKIINRNYVLEWLGINSLTIMLVHEPVKRLIISFYARLTGIEIDVARTSILHSLILLVVVLAILVPIVLMVNKYAYFLMGKSKR